MSRSKERPRRLVRGATLRAVSAIGALIYGVFAIALVQACSSSSSSTPADSGVCDPIAVDFDAGDAGQGTCWRHFFELPCGIPSGTQLVQAAAPGNCQFNFNDCAQLCGAPGYLSCVVVGAACQIDGGVVNSNAESSIGAPIIHCLACN